MIVADSGFLLSVYLAEATSPVAMALFQSANESITITPFKLLEVRNGLNRSPFTKKLTAAQTEGAWVQLQHDLVQGLFAEADVTHPALFRTARVITDKHTPNLGARTLDLLHVAAALLLQATQFWSFDERQRKVAQAEGLFVRP